MTGVLRKTSWRTVIGLIAAYAVALQAVFTTLAPMPAHASANDPFAAHCYGNGNGNAGLPDGSGAPSPASGKMHCVFCGACAGGFVVLPVASGQVQRLQAAAPIAFFLPASTNLPAASKARDGPARAPPLMA
jgi:hypothetical protein